MTRFLGSRNTSIKGFLFFLILTTILAVLIKLSKTYTTTLQIPIQVSDVVIDKTVQEITPQQLEAAVTMSGFSLLRNMFSEPILELPFSKLTETKPGTYNYTLHKTAQPIAKAIIGDFQTETLSHNTITVVIEHFEQKKVPIKSKLSFAFSNGYDKSAPLQLSPDSILVTGTSTKLSKINEVFTVQKTYTAVRESIQDKIAIDTTGLNALIDPKNHTISVIQDVTKFTEGSFSIPVKIVNDTEQRIQIFPKNVNVIFNVSLEKFEAVKPENFTVISNFNTHKTGDTFLPLELVAWPKELLNVRLATKQVRFISIDK